MYVKSTTISCTVSVYDVFLAKIRWRKFAKNIKH